MLHNPKISHMELTGLTPAEAIKIHEDVLVKSPESRVIILNSIAWERDRMAGLTAPQQ